MKHFLPILFFTGLLFGQDTLRTVSGQVVIGKLMEQEEEYVFFKPDGAQQSQKIPIRLIKEIRLGNGEIIDFGNDYLTAVNNNSPLIDSDSLDPTRSAFGAGVGFAGLLHIDYQRWMTEQTSFEVGLTPLIVHNVVAVAVTQHFNLPSSTKSFDTNLVVSGMWMHIVNMGGIAGGPGMRMGLEIINQRFGVSLAGGPAIAIGGEFDGDLLGDVRLTFWKVK